MEDTFANYVLQTYIGDGNNTILSVCRGEEAIAKLLFIQSDPSLANYSEQERAQSIFFTYRHMMRRYPCYIWKFVIGSDWVTNGSIIGHRITRQKWDAYKELYNL